ncbi:hypothetical protein B0H13DRAFT_2266791 [Mycena leptocephala]|nr:hypothetical protein B0H13DRAFT_2266791 [Mycena leptocephala]
MNCDDERHAAVAGILRTRLVTREERGGGEDRGWGGGGTVRIAHGDADDTRISAGVGVKSGEKYAVRDTGICGQGHETETGSGDGRRVLRGDGDAIRGGVRSVELVNVVLRKQRLRVPSARAAITSSVHRVPTIARIHWCFDIRRRWMARRAHGMMVGQRQDREMGAVYCAGTEMRPGACAECRAGECSPAETTPACASARAAARRARRGRGWGAEGM